MYLRKTLILTLAAFCAAGAAETETEKTPAPAATEVNAVLASVDGEPICLGDILPVTRSAEAQVFATRSGQERYDAVREIRRTAVEDMVSRKLIMGAFRRAPFEVAEDEVDRRLDAFAEEMGCRSRRDFSAKLRSQGNTIEKMREAVRDQFIYELAVYRRLRVVDSVTPREVHEYFEAHRADFSTPAKLQLAMIQLDDKDSGFVKKLAEVDSKLAVDPDAFAEVAASYSTGPGAEQGGVLGEIEEKRLRPEFAAAMPGMEIGRVYGPVKTADGTVYLKILSRTAAADTGEREAAEIVRRKIEIERRAAALRDYVKELKSQAVIRYFF
ncbi:MAG: peptidylprolyl isomerase [Victivallaceae bacterium]|nr:peptidylprolyl isomerase [Victivallaceae bacterium]